MNSVDTPNVSHYSFRKFFGPTYILTGADRNPATFDNSTDIWFLYLLGPPHIFGHPQVGFYPPENVYDTYLVSLSFHNYRMT